MNGTKRARPAHASMHDAKRRIGKCRKHLTDASFAVTLDQQFSDHLAIVRRHPQGVVVEFPKEDRLPK